jgi:putative membrane protein
MLVVHPIKELGRSLPGLVVLLLAGSNSGDGPLWGLIGAAIVSLFALSRWFTTRYRLGSEQVQIREGVVRRRTLAARLDRVRTVDVTSTALHRALGLARVEIGTGVSDRKGKSTLRLDGLLADDAARLRGDLLHRSPLVTDAPAAVDSDGSAAPAAVSPLARADEEVEIARLDPSWIRFAPFTFSGVFTGLAIAGFVWRLQSEGNIDVERLGPLHTLARQVGNAPVWEAVVEIVVAALAFIVVASTVGYVLAYWNFRLSRHSGGTFHVTRGLLTTRATSIDADRLRGVGISQSLPMRLVCGARTVAIATGLQVGRGASAQRGGTVLLPEAPMAEAQRVAGAVTGEPELATVRLIGHGQVATRRRFTRAVGGAVVFALAVGLAWLLVGAGPWWLLALLLVPLAVPLAVDRARNLGHLVRDGYLLTQSGSVSRRRAMLQANAIIGWNFRQSFFQRRAGVITLVATTAAGRQSYRLLDLPAGDARQVAESAVPGLLADFTA